MKIESLYEIGDTVWLMDSKDEEKPYEFGFDLIPGLINGIVQYRKDVGFVYDVYVKKGDDKPMEHYGVRESSLYRTPEDFIKKIESQKFEDQIKILSDAFTNFGTIEVEQ